MLLVVGRIGRAHGVHGEATIEVRTDDPDSRFQIGAVLTTDPASHGPLTITSGRVHNGTLLLGFRGVDDRNAVEKLRNTLLLADIDIEQETGEGVYHIAQIKGCSVFLSDGTEVGIVSDVLELPAHDTLVIDLIQEGNKVGIKEGHKEERLVPLVSSMIVSIDISQRKIVIDPPVGLL